MGDAARRWGFPLAAFLLTLGLGVVAGEVFIRVAKPNPRAQVIRGGGDRDGGHHQIRLIHGQPVWAEPGTVERRNEDCRTADSYDVMMLGSSIFYGSSYTPDQVMSRHLQDALDASEGGPWCVFNLAQPAVTSLTKLALAQESIPTLKPDLVLWEVWHNDPGGFVLLGEDAYNISELQTDEAGYPNWLPIPSGLRRWLFHRSRLFEYAALALAPRRVNAYEEKWRVLREETLPELAALTEAHGGELVLVFTPMLDVPFAESVELHKTKYRGYQWVTAWATEHNVRQYGLAEALVGESVEALRHDPCCHYSAQGHEAVGKQLATWVREVREDR